MDSGQYCVYGSRREVAAGIKRQRTLPTADSPRSTSFTLLVGFGAAGVESAIGSRGACREFAGRSGSAPRDWE